MPLPMEPYRRSVTGLPRPASTYRGARRNAARSCKVQVLKLFNRHISGWTEQVLYWLPQLATHRRIVDRWRTRTPDHYARAWTEFLTDGFRPLAA
jgi:hypothetical protein